MTLKVYGANRIGQVAERCCALAQRLAAAIHAEPLLQRATAVPLNVVCFRYGRGMTPCRGDCRPPAGGGRCRAGRVVLRRVGEPSDLCRGRERGRASRREGGHAACCHGAAGRWRMVSGIRGEEHGENSAGAAGASVPASIVGGTAAAERGAVPLGVREFRRRRRAPDGADRGGGRDRRDCDDCGVCRVAPPSARRCAGLSAGPHSLVVCTAVKPGPFGPGCSVVLRRGGPLR